VKIYDPGERAEFPHLINIYGRYCIKRSELNPRPHVTWCLTLKWPFKKRIYTVNNDAFQLRHPLWSIRFDVYSDPFTHQCTEEQLNRSLNA
jgi:hypothetical protein